MRLAGSLNFLFVLAAVLAALAAPCALAQRQDPLAAAGRLTERSGMAVQVRGFANQFTSELWHQRGKVPDATVTELTGAAAEAFRPEVLQKEIVEALSKKLRIDEMDAAIAWLETPAGRRITQAEEQSTSTVDDAAVRKYLASLKDGKPAAERAVLIREIIVASYAEDITARHLQALALGVALGVDSTQPAAERLGLTRMRARIFKEMPEEYFKEKIRPVQPGAFAYAYRDVSDADLAAYLAFLRTKAGTRYSLKMGEALNGALIRAGVRLGELVERKSAGRKPA